MGEFELAAAMLQLWITDITKAVEENATAAERGCGYLSAIKILEDPFDSIDIPRNYLRLAVKIVQRGYMPEEIEAAYLNMYGNTNWQSLECQQCVRCGKKNAFWRKIYTSSKKDWRIFQGENHIPLCSKCAKIINFQSFHVRCTLGEWVWGDRFRALNQYFNQKPYDWNNRIEYPLWPKDYGGSDYWSGSGHASCIPYNRPSVLDLPVQERFEKINQLLSPQQPGLFLFFSA